jgi:hypothetical protein
MWDSYKFMKVYFEQSGGIAGISKTVSIDSDSLAQEEASKLLRLIEDAKFFDLPSQPSTPLRGADHLNYKVTVVENESKRHSINTTDRTMPSNVGPLISYLKEKTLRKR